MPIFPKLTLKVSPKLEQFVLPLVPWDAQIDQNIRDHGSPGVHATSARMQCNNLSD